MCCMYLVTHVLHAYGEHVWYMFYFTHVLYYVMHNYAIVYTYNIISQGIICLIQQTIPFSIVNVSDIGCAPPF